MHSQLYLSGRLAINPKLTQTKKGRLWVRLLLETELVRTSGQGFQSETVVLPISLFSREAEAVKDLRSGDVLIGRLSSLRHEIRRAGGSGETRLPDCCRRWS